MKSLVFAATVVALAATAATAQKASRSAGDIVCAMTGDCTATTGKQISTPNEAAFSFSKSKPAAGARQTPDEAAFAFSKRKAAAQQARTAAGRPMHRAPTAAAGLDMRINFALGSADLTPQARAEAAEFAKAMAMPAMADRKFVVEGHTDAIGGRDYNLDLSQKRADSVVGYLKSLGVAEDRIQSKGYGFDKPLPNVGAKAPANRRVEFVPA